MKSSAEIAAALLHEMHHPPGIADIGSAKRWTAKLMSLINKTERALLMEDRAAKKKEAV